MNTLSNMNANGQATFSEKVKENFQSKVFGHATASSIAIASGNLPLSTQFQLQKRVLAIAPSSKVNTPAGTVDLSNPTSSRSIIAAPTTSHRSWNNRLTSMDGVKKLISDATESARSAPRPPPTVLNLTCYSSTDEENTTSTGTASLHV